MLRRLRVLAAVLVVASLALPGSAVAASSSLGQGQLESELSPPVVDMMLMRPLGLAGLAVAAVAWIPTQAFTMLVRPQSEWHEPVDFMLRKPYEFVFVDPIGSH